MEGARCIVFKKRGDITFNGVKINLDELAKQQPKEEETKVTKTFSGCNSLYLEELLGRILVMPGAVDEIYVEVSGAKSLVEGVKMESTRGAVSLCYRGERGVSGGTTVVNKNAGGVFSGIFGGRNQVVMTGGRGMHINSMCIDNASGVTIISDGDSITINAGSSSTIETKVTVPSSTRVVYDGGAGSDLQIGELDGDLEINVRYNGDVKVGAAKNLRVRIEGSGDVTVERLTGGEADLDVRGSGDIRIQTGEASNLRARIAGSGDIRAMITAVDADLTVAGSGDIKVTRVTGRLSRRCRGSGDIDVYSK